MQHDWKHVERPGGSHTALDGKNHTPGSIPTYAQQAGSSATMRKVTTTFETYLGQRPGRRP